MGLKLKVKLKGAKPAPAPDLPSSDSEDSEKEYRKQKKREKKHKKDKKKKRKSEDGSSTSSKKPKLSLKLTRKSVDGGASTPIKAETTPVQSTKQPRKHVDRNNDEEEEAVFDFGDAVERVKPVEAQKPQNVEVTKPPPHQADSDDDLFGPDSSNEEEVKDKAPAKKEKETNESGGNKSDKELFCVCRTPNDDTAFYLGCDGECQGWFHPACVGFELCNRVDHTSGGRSCVKVTAHAHVDTEEGVFTCPSCTRTGFAQWKDRATGSVKEVANADFYFDKLLRRQLKRDELRKEGLGEEAIKLELEKGMESDSSDDGKDPVFSDVDEASPDKASAKKARTASTSSAEGPGSGRKGSVSRPKPKVAKGLKNLGIKQRPHSSSIDKKKKLDATSAKEKEKGPVRAGSLEELKAAEEMRLAREAKEKRDLEEGRLLQEMDQKPEGEVTEVDFMEQIRSVSRSALRSTKRIPQLNRVPLKQKEKDELLQRQVNVQAWFAIPSQVENAEESSDKQQVIEPGPVFGTLSREMLLELWSVSVRRQKALEMRDQLRRERERQVIEGRRQDVEKHRLEAQREREKQEKAKKEQEAEQDRLQKQKDDERAQQRAKERAERERMRKETSTMDQGIIMATGGNLPPGENEEDEDDWGF